MKIRICLPILLLVLSAKYTQAQNQQNFCPGFEFIRNMQKGVNGQDVLVLQKILNLDSRTQIAQSGVGSKGQETKIFGEKTREALKRFQALFIEYTLTADGIFQGRTRELISNMCAGVGIQTFKTSSTSAITDFFSTRTESTNTLENTDPNLDYFLDQLPRAFQLEQKNIIEKYYRKLMHTIYPPIPTINDMASQTASTTNQSTVPQVTVSSVPF